MAAGHRRIRAGRPLSPLALGTLVLVALLGFPHPASPRTWYIQNDGSGNAPTVQAGIDSAAVGDTVLVGPGAYLENLSIVGKDLVLKSEMGPEATILDGSSRQETVIYMSGQTRAMVVVGFTITGGVGHPRSGYADGGGIHLADLASPTVRGNRIVGNGDADATFFGGGIVAWTYPVSPLIESNLFEANVARLGGAISIASGNTEIRGNTFRENACRFDGGAIYAVFSSGSVTIEGNQFWNNTAGDHGGALNTAGSASAHIRIASNLFVGNQAMGSARDHIAGGAIVVGDLNGQVMNNTIVESIGPTWTSCAGGGLSLSGTLPTLEVAYNILAFNHSCGLTCEFGVENVLGPNLFWMNEGGDLRLTTGGCPSDWVTTQIFSDPMFCEPEAGNYTVSIESPALTGPVPMGVWTAPGCGPGVPIQPTTWGRLKSLYR